MVDEKVSHLANGFAGFWSEVFSAHPRYQLDFSWPSVGVVNFLLENVRRKKTFDQQSQGLIRSAAAYLAVIASRCWSRFPDDLNIVAVIRDRSEFEIHLRTSGGRFLENDQYFGVALCRTLQDILLQPANPFPAFEQFAAPLLPQSNIINLFASGLFSGLCPYGQGAWKEKNAADFIPYLEPLYEELAQTTASWYGRVFPTEDLGTLPEIYLRHVVVPPAGFEELHPALHATWGLIQALKQLGAAEEQMAKVALHLSSVVDETISSAGFALGAALYDLCPSDRFLAQVELRGIRAAALRPAVTLARKALGREVHWPGLFLEGKHEEAQRLAALEKELGLLPLLQITDFTSPQYAPLYFAFDAIASSNAQAARESMSHFTWCQDMPPESVLQEAVLAVFLNDLDTAERYLAELDSDDIEQHAETRFYFYKIRAEIAQRRDQTENQLEELEQAFAAGCSSSADYAAVGTQLAALKYSAGDSTETLNVLKQVITRRPSCVTAHLLHAFLLRESNAEEDYAAKLQLLYSLAPNDERVFSLLKDELVKTKIHELEDELLQPH